MIVTERLEIKPLNYIELIKYIHSRNWHIKTDEDERKIYEYTVKPMLEEPEEKHLFYTFWHGFYEGEHILDIGLLRPPNEHKVVEIWCHVDENYWGQGFGTEAIIAFTDWCDGIEGIDFVGASVEPSNEASKKMLLKSGYKYATDNLGMNIFFANLIK